MRHEPLRTTDLYRSDLERHLFTLEGAGAWTLSVSVQLARWVRAMAALVIW